MASAARNCNCMLCKEKKYRKMKKLSKPDAKRLAKDKPDGFHKINYRGTLRTIFVKNGQPLWFFSVGKCHFAYQGWGANTILGVK